MGSRKQLLVRRFTSLRAVAARLPRGDKILAVLLLVVPFREAPLDRARLLLAQLLFDGRVLRVLLAASSLHEGARVPTHLESVFDNVLANFNALVGSFFT